MLGKNNKGTGEKKSFLSNLMGGGRKVIHYEGMSKTDEERVIKLADALRDYKDDRPIDVGMIVKEAFPRFEETIGAADFQKVKKYFGIGYKAPQKNVGKPGEVNVLISKLKTIENAMYYIYGLKEVVEGCASKLIYAPDDMDKITRAKVVIMYYRVFFNHEQFVEDYVGRTNPMTRKQEVVYSEAQALSNNNKVIGPEEIFVLYHNKIKHVSGIYYDAVLFEVARVAKREQNEIFEFGEIIFDDKVGRFVSVNKCMVSPTFAKIRLLKKKINDPRPYVMVEMFANQDLIKERMDVICLYNIYKMIKFTPWKSLGATESDKIRTLSGSVFVDKVQEYYKPLSNLCIADEVEANRWVNLMLYLSNREYVMETTVDPFGNPLEKPKSYNMGVLWGAIAYSHSMQYTGSWTTVDQDFDNVDKLLALPNAEDVFLAYKRGEINEDEVTMGLGITEEYAKANLMKYPDVEVLMEQVRAAEAEIIKKREAAAAAAANGEKAEEPEAPAEVEVPKVSKDVPYESDIQDERDAAVSALCEYAISKGYIENPSELAMDIVNDVLLTYFEDYIVHFTNPEIGGKKIMRNCGIPEEFAAGFFNLKKLDIEMIEKKLLELKNNRHSRTSGNAYYENRGIVRLYCYVINNNIACGPKMKVPKRNSSLKPKILEGLIA